MVGVDGSSPFAPTKIGRHQKHLAVTPGAFFLAATPGAFFLAVRKKVRKSGVDANARTPETSRCDAVTDAAGEVHGFVGAPYRATGGWEGPGSNFQGQDACMQPPPTCADPFTVLRCKPCGRKARREFILPGGTCGAGSWRGRRRCISRPRSGRPLFLSSTGEALCITQYGVECRRRRLCRSILETCRKLLRLCRTRVGDIAGAPTRNTSVWSSESATGARCVSSSRARASMPTLVQELV